MKRRLLALALAFSWSPLALAAGFAVDTQGGRATGLGTAITAHVDDPSAVFYNPAGMLLTERVTVMAGATLITPQLQFTSGPAGATATAAPSESLLQPGVTTHNRFGISPPPHVFATAKFGDDLAAGVGLFTNFGDVLQWPPDWQGRFKAVSTSLATFNLNPSIAWRPHHTGLRFGAGLQLVHGTVEVVRQLDFGDAEATADIAGAASGIGFNAGLQADLIPDVVSIGLAYRSGVILPFTGGARFTGVPIEFSGIVHDQGIAATFRTPNTAMAGVSVRPLRALLLAADVHYYRWRSLQSVAVSFEDPTLDQVEPKRWHDTLNFHLGAEYRLSPALSLRAGAVYDPAPGLGQGLLSRTSGRPPTTLTPDLPDSDRLKACLGVGYTRGQLRFDAGYQFVYLVPVRSAAPEYEGRYQGSAHVLGISLAYTL